MSKQGTIRQFVESNSGSTFKTSEMCERVGCTLPTLLRFIKDNDSLFTKVGHGKYQLSATSQQAVVAVAQTPDEDHSPYPSLVDEIVNEELSSVDQVTTVYQDPQPSTIKPTFDW